MTTRAPTTKPAVDPLAQTAPQERVEASTGKPAGERSDSAELDRLARENRDLLDDNARLNRAVDDLNDQVAEALRERPRWRISGPGEAALVITALVELHRANCGASRYDNRFLAAAVRLGDALAADTAPPT